jgi:hypothetical protein
MVTVSEERDLEVGPDQQAAPSVPRAAPLVRQAPISSKWRTTTRRGAYAAMILALTVGYTWVSATQDWGWPLLPAAVILIAGIYVLLTTYVDSLPIFGRERPVDHSTKYTLWFDQTWDTWSINVNDPGKLDLYMALQFSNGGNKVIEFWVDQLDMEVDGAESVSYASDLRGLRLLPGRNRRVGLPWVRGIPEGSVSGTIRYAMYYGPPPLSRPSYRRTHTIRFALTQPITCDMVANSGLEGVETEWWDVQSEEDKDLP